MTSTAFSLVIPKRLGRLGSRLFFHESAITLHTLQNSLTSFSVIPLPYDTPRQFRISARYNCRTFNIHVLIGLCYDRSIRRYRNPTRRRCGYNKSMNCGYTALTRCCNNILMRFDDATLRSVVMPHNEKLVIPYVYHPSIV